MSTAAQALLFVYGDCGQSVTEDQFNDWYDNEHAPLRTTVPGFLTAARYRALDVPPKTFPKWLALYDLSSKEVMQSQAYKDLQSRASDNERQVVGNLEVLNRRVYELLDFELGSKDLAKSKGSGDKPATFIYIVHMQVVKNEDKDQDESRYKTQENHLIQWYTSTRIPLIALVPGYMRSRVFRLTEHAELAGRAAPASFQASPFSLLAIHEWSVEGPKVLNSPEFKMCMTDAEQWKMEKQGTIAMMEERLFELYKVFP